MTYLKESLVKELEEIDGVENRPSPVAGGSALYFKGKEFAHFHNDSELDLRLTKKLIHQENLSHPVDSEFHPNRSNNSPWIELRYSRKSDVQEITRLVRLAISVIKV